MRHLLGRTADIDFATMVLAMSAQLTKESSDPASSSSSPPMTLRSRPTPSPAPPSPPPPPPPVTPGGTLSFSIPPFS